MKLAIFQDYAKDHANDAASIFFELANAPLVGYRVADKINASSPSSVDEDDAMLIIKQHSDAKAHTGGIVWETSYMLADFLSTKFGKSCDRNKTNGDCNYPLGKTLEIGAGCGMLGLILATTKLASRVVMTEATEGMDILTDNVERNVIETHLSTNQRSSDNDAGIHGTSHLPICPKGCISVRRLRWENFQEDAAADSTSEAENDLQPHSFDTIVGTDVVFSTSLVCPLLETIEYMSRGKNAQSASSTRIYLCLQMRCEDSHSLLFSEAHKYGLEVEDVTDELASLCHWSVELDCLLLKINVKKEMTNRRKKSSKEWKKKSSKAKSKKNDEKVTENSKKRKRD